MPLQRLLAQDKALLPALVGPFRPGARRPGFLHFLRILAEQRQPPANLGMNTVRRPLPHLPSSRPLRVPPALVLVPARRHEEGPLRVGHGEAAYPEAPDLHLVARHMARRPYAILID